jgi:integrase
MGRGCLWRLQALRYDGSTLPARIPAHFPHMAYIRTYRDGWRAEVQRNGQRLSKLFKTKREAQAWALQQEGKAEALGKGWRTFAEAVEKYEEAETAKKKAQQWERNTLARLLAEFGESTPLGSIDQPRIAAWRDKRLKSVSASTVNREANLLRHMLRVARLEWHWLTANPFEGVKMPRDNQPRHQVWKWQQIKRVLRAKRTGKTAEMQRAFHIALRTGMRLSEVLQAPALFDKRRSLVVLPTSKTTERVEVPVGRIGAKLLTKAKFTVNPNEGSVLFGKLCRELLITGLTFHDSRATALTLLSRKVDVMTLAKISRHQDLRTLQQVYYRETAEQIAARI